ncbi:MAG: glutamate racemase [Candidatus Saccharibacteria bacterium]|nr:glutamate racemase [Candidatus Saccharibacteria bacterium]
MKIGVFDSGIGGKSIAAAIQKAMPEAQVIYKQDEKNLPYGTKSKAELLHFVLPFIQEFNGENCDAVVIACNTVTTNTINHVRLACNAPVIGIEPMVKPAARVTKSKKIAVCATPTTLNSKRYQELKHTYAAGIEVFEPDCSDWSTMIEAKKINQDKIDRQIKEVCKRGADVIVLGCTHYHWIEKEIQKVADEFHAKVIQPEEAIVRRLKQVINNENNRLHNHKLQN